MARHAEEARKIEKAGLIAKAERLHAEVALADARMEARSAERRCSVGPSGLAEPPALARGGGTHLRSFHGDVGSRAR
jgi:hypothetical protein